MKKKVLCILSILILIVGSTVYAGFINNMDKEDPISKNSAAIDVPDQPGQLPEGRYCNGPLKRGKCRATIPETVCRDGHNCF